MYATLNLLLLLKVLVYQIHFVLANPFHNEVSFGMIGSSKRIDAKDKLMRACQVSEKNQLHLMHFSLIQNNPTLIISD